MHFNMQVKKFLLKVSKYLRKGHTIHLEGWVEVGS